MNRHPWRREHGARLNPQVEAALTDPSVRRVRDLISEAGRQPTRLAERVRQLATRLAKRSPMQTGAILNGRDRVLLALYAAEAGGRHCAWSDGALFAEDDRAGIAAVVTLPDGEPLAEISRAQPASENIFDLEIAAVIAALELAAGCGIRRLRLHTDCSALVSQWREGPEMQAARATARRFDEVELRAVPRLHNQLSHRLAQQAAQND